jgi:cytidine deaminase
MSEKTEELDLDGQVAKQLIDKARKARDSAYCPYSEYPVGAALLTDKGIFTGVNVEVSGRSTSVHAEMMVAFKAVEAGAKEFVCLAVSPKGQTGEAPCGLCQHTLSEFTDDLRIVEDTGEGSFHTEYTLKDLIGPAYSAATRHR